MRHLSQWILILSSVAVARLSHAQEASASSATPAEETAVGNMNKADRQVGAKDVPDASPATTGSVSAPPPKRAATTRPPARRAPVRTADDPSRTHMTLAYYSKIKNKGIFRRILARNNPALTAEMMRIMKAYPTSFLDQTEQLKNLEARARAIDTANAYYHGAEAVIPQFNQQMLDIEARDVLPDFQFDGLKNSGEPLLVEAGTESALCLDPAECAHGSAVAPAALPHFNVRLGFGVGPRPLIGPEPLVRTGPPASIVEGGGNGFGQLFAVLGPLLLMMMNRNNGGGRGGYGGFNPYPFGNLAMRPPPAIRRFAGGPGFGGRGAPSIAGPAIGGGPLPIYQPGQYGGSIYNQGGGLFGGVGGNGALGVGYGGMANAGMLNGIPPSVAGPAFG